MLGKLFSWSRKRESDPGISFGRYSDNNKSVEQVEKWKEADNLFKQNQYFDSIKAVFDYLADDEQENIEREFTEGGMTFRLYQGSKLVRGEITGSRLAAEVALVTMPEPSVPVMRRLLEMNFNLYYGRYSLQDETVYMRFDTETSTASPNKLYYGLKELATKSDKQDDLLLNEFSFLKPVDTAHIRQISDEEKTLKYEYLQRWIRLTLDYIGTLDAEKFSSGISYLLLTLAFRIDYLISPEGKLLSEIEKIASAYYGKDDKSSAQRNPTMISGFRKLMEKPREDIFSQLFRSKYTFAIVVPHNLKVVTDVIKTALENMIWYRDNNYPDVANKVMEYGFSYSQYSYSLPRPMSEFFRLFMQVNYPDYFGSLGFGARYYDEVRNEFDEELIKEFIDLVIDHWKPKYPSLMFRTKKLKFDNLVNFNQSFLQEVSELDFD